VALSGHSAGTFAFAPAAGAHSAARGRSPGMSLEAPPSPAVAMPPPSPADAGTKRKAEDPLTPAAARASDDADGPKHASDSATKLSRYVPTLADAPLSAADASGLATSRDPGGKPDAADASAHRNSYVVSSSRGYSTSQSELRATTGAWYFEVVVARLGDDGHARVGWAERLAETDAPVGADASGYAYCDVDGEKVHEGRREPYGEAFVAGDVVGCYLEVAAGAEAKGVPDAVAAAPASAADATVPTVSEGSELASLASLERREGESAFEARERNVEGSEDVEDARATGIEDATRRDDGGGDDDETSDETKKKRAEEPLSLRFPFVRRVGFCRNGVWQGLAFEPPACAPITAKNGAFHPSVSLYTHGKVGEHQDAKVAFNFGPTFVFPVSSFGDAPAPRPMCDAAFKREAS
jgi:hypothetical protein